MVSQNNNLRYLQEEKVDKYLKYLLLILATEVLEFFTTEVQNYRDETELWFLNNFTDDQLRIYKTRIYNFQLFVVIEMIPFSSVPNLNLPSFVAEFITCFHDNVMFHWAQQIDDYKIYSSDNHDFWTRKQLLQQEAASTLAAQVTVKLRRETANEEEEDQVNTAEKEILRETVQPALMSKKTNTQNKENYQKVTVTKTKISATILHWRTKVKFS